MKTRAGRDAIVADVQQDQPTSNVPQHESLVRHPIRTTVHEAEHLREVASKGQSAATPAIIAAAVIAFITPVAAFLMLLVFAVAPNAYR